jgi:phosphohistidine phosphatase SixA
MFVIGRRDMRASRIGFLTFCGFMAGLVPASAAAVSADLIGGLRQGGYVLVMRHASSPAMPPAKTEADPENIGLERQLDERGRTSAEAMGRAFKTLHIPVGEIFSSPTYRARETIKLAGFGPPKTVVELGDQGHSMARLNGPGPAAWLKAKAAEKPAPGRDTLIVTHMPNITAAFPDDAAGLQDGETLVFKPDGHGHVSLVAKVPIEDWAGSVP